MTHVQTQPKKIRIKKDNQQQSKRTREQKVDDMHILKQQMTGPTGNLIANICFGDYYNETCNIDKVLEL